MLRIAIVINLLTENYREIHNPWHLSHENISHVWFFLPVALSCRMLKEDQLVNMLSHSTGGTHAVRSSMPRAQPKLMWVGLTGLAAESQHKEATFRKKVTQDQCSVFLITKMQNPCFNTWQIKTFFVYLCGWGNLSQHDIVLAINSCFTRAVGYSSMIKIYIFYSSLCSCGTSHYLWLLTAPSCLALWSLFKAYMITHSIFLSSWYATLLLRWQKEVIIGVWV